MNILYITVDALRADHVTADVMPFVRSFIEDAVEFTGCVANGPGTPWSFPGLLASQYSGATDGFGIPGTESAPPTLAEVLRSEGYVTAGFTDNRFASSDYNYDRGVTEMHDTGATEGIKRLKQAVRTNVPNDSVLYGALLRSYHVIDDVFVNLSDRNSRFARAGGFVDEIIEWTSEQNQDWFVWFHPMDVHDPYEAPEEYQLQYLDERIPRRRSQNLATKAVHHPEEVTETEWRLQQQLYKAECSYLDDQLRRLFESLAESRRDTLIVFTADHGDMHGEHGRGGHPQEFWEEVIRVPLAIDVPGREADTVDGQVELIDVPPTILDALDIDVPTYWDGHSLWPRVDDNANPREHAFIDVGAELDRQHAGVRRADGWKLMRHEGTEWLFDLSTNPEEDERDDERETEPEIYRELSAALDEHLDEMETRREHGATGIEDEEMIEDHLRELGYLE